MRQSFQYLVAETSNGVKQEESDHHRSGQSTYGINDIDDGLRLCKRFHIGAKQR